MARPGSSSQQPDLDWSQIRETIKMLTLSVTQVESGVQEGDAAINTLTDSFTAMVKHLNIIAEQLDTLPDSEPRALAKQHCAATSATVQASVMAFQFYDRLQQCLQHVTSGLLELSELIEAPERLYNPFEWKKLQDHIKSRYTMESEKLMFDAILEGKSIAEAIELSQTTAQITVTDDEDIELF
jgi:hypothetical protein